MTRTLTLTEVASLPAVTDLVTAGQALGLGRTKAYELARAGKFPCPVIRAGKTWLVPTAGLLALLGLPVPGTPSPGTGHGEPVRTPAGESEVTGKERAAPGRRRGGSAHPPAPARQA